MTQKNAYAGSGQPNSPLTHIQTNLYVSTLLCGRFSVQRSKCMHIRFDTGYSDQLSQVCLSPDFRPIHHNVNKL